MVRFCTTFADNWTTTGCHTMAITMTIKTTQLVKYTIGHHSPVLARSGPCSADSNDTSVPPFTETDPDYTSVPPFMDSLILELCTVQHTSRSPASQTRDEKPIAIVLTIQRSKSQPVPSLGSPRVTPMAHRNRTLMKKPGPRGNAEDPWRGVALCRLLNMNSMNEKRHFWGATGKGRWPRRSKKCLPDYQCLAQVSVSLRGISPSLRIKST